MTLWTGEPIPTQAAFPTTAPEFADGTRVLVRSGTERGRVGIVAGSTGDGWIRVNLDGRPYPLFIREELEALEL